MLGNRKYRRWLNNQLLEHKEKLFLEQEYYDHYEGQEIKSIIISSSFKDSNYSIPTSVWIKLCSDKELYELYLNYNEKNNQEIITNYKNDNLIRIQNICTNLNISDNILTNNDNYIKNFHYINDSNLENYIFGYLNQIFQKTLSLLDHENLFKYIQNIENYIIQLICENKTDTHSKNTIKKHKLIFVSYNDCKITKIIDLNQDDKHFTQYESIMKFCNNSNTIIIEGCNKLLRKITHCLCNTYSLISKSISSSKNYSKNDIKTMIISLSKSNNSSSLPNIKIATLLKINQLYSKKTIMHSSSY